MLKVIIYFSYHWKEKTAKALAIVIHAIIMVLMLSMEMLNHGEYGIEIPLKVVILLLGWKALHDVLEQIEIDLRVDEYYNPFGDEYYNPFKNRKR